MSMVNDDVSVNALHTVRYRQ